jgi:hypothetical protein
MKVSTLLDGFADRWLLVCCITSETPPGTTILLLSSGATEECMDVREFLSTRKYCSRTITGVASSIDHRISRQRMKTRSYPDPEKEIAVQL